MTYRPHKNGVDDLVLLTDMSNEAINQTLQQHFAADEIYVYIGHVLISLNPYKEIRGLYGEQPLKKYKGRLPYENAPHVYALAEGVHKTMIQQRDNHCVIISGESGAGKTENSKKIMEYIAAVSSKAAGVVKVKEQILESNPLLEAFGNAKTLRNDNSSRFGKYFEIQFNFSGDPVGGKIRNYLLEKIRVVQQQQGERNFHIFYQLLAGASASEKKELELYAPKFYRFLNQSGCYEVNGINDARDYTETRHAMDVIGMTQEEQAEVFRLVASILHIGNLEFKAEAKGTGIENPQILDIAAKVLRVTPDALKKSLTTKTITTRTETIGSPLTPEEAAYSRNSLAKSLYGKVFDWIVLRSNDLMFREDHEGFLIGVLDIYGFEIFDRNSFEQLCINFCNEKLHQIFIELTLKAEQEEYKKEQIKWEDVAYYNNKPCVELIEKKNGVLGYLDEECLFPKGTDLTFHEKLFANIKGQPNFLKSPSKNCFVIQHYAGEVTYSVEGFLDKNKDLLFPDIIQMLAASSSNLIKSLFQRDLALLKESNKRPITAGTQFRNQMSSLMDSLRACTPHYIRCIKPNTNKRAGEWNKELTGNQIKYLGLLENVRVRRAGYAFRLPYGQFLRRYKMLSPKTWPVYRGDDKEGCRLLIDEIKISQDAAFGVSKAFIKSPETVFKLEEMREKALDVIVVKIQRCWRSFQARKWYLELRAAMQDIFYGKKQRRKKSLNRKYYGDYLRVQNEPSFKMIMTKFGDSSVLFADNVWKTNRKYKREKRVLVITDRSFYILKPGKKLAVKQRYEVRDVSKIALSALADDFFIVNFNTHDVVFENARKTEICVCLKEHLGKQGKTLQITFADEIAFTMRDNKKRVFNFEVAEGQPEGGVLMAKGDRGTVKVPKGLDAHTNPSNTYIKKGQRGAAPKAGGQATYGQEDAPSWGASQATVAKKAPPPQPSRVRSVIQLQTAVAVFDYKSQAPDELDLKEGDVVEIVGKDASGWWTGRLRGKQGLFPGNYVKEQASGPTRTDRSNYPYGV